MRSGQLDVLLVSPERLANPRFAGQLRSMLDTIGLIVIDEAHCVSDWGFDFRPDYQRLSQVLLARRRRPRRCWPPRPPPTSGSPPTWPPSSVPTRSPCAARWPGPRCTWPWCRGSASARALRLGGRGPRPPARVGHRVRPDGGRDRAPGRVPAPAGPRGGRLLGRAGSRPSARPSRSSCATTSSRRWWPPRRWAWATTSPTWASASTSARPRRRWPTTSRSVGPAGRWSEASAVLLPAESDAALWRYFATATVPDPDHAAKVLAVLDAGPGHRGRAGGGHRHPAGPAGVAAQDHGGGRRHGPGRGGMDRHRHRMVVRRAPSTTPWWRPAPPRPTSCGPTPPGRAV